VKISRLSLHISLLPGFGSKTKSGAVNCTKDFIVEKKAPNFIEKKVQLTALRA
jgi:hypothetical protein